MRTPWAKKKVMKGWKTVTFNVIMSALMVMSLMNPEADTYDAEQVRTMIENAEPFIVAAWGIGNILLRAITDTPIFKKE